MRGLPARFGTHPRLRRPAPRFRFKPHGAGSPWVLAAPLGALIRYPGASVLFLFLLHVRVAFAGDSSAAPGGLPPTDPAGLAGDPPSPSTEQATPSTEPVAPPTEPGAPPTEPAVPPTGGVAPPTLSAEEIAALEAALASETASPAAPAQIGSLQSMNPDLSFIGDVAFAYFTADEPMMAGGHDPNANGFALQQLELSVRKSVDPYFRFDANLAFSLEGVEIEEVYATTLALPGRFQARAGYFLTRIGRINSTHLHSWDFVDQPFAIGRVFGGEGNRGLGLEASWLAPTPWYVELVASATGAAGEGTARSFYGDADPGFETPLDLQDTVAIKQFFPMGPNFSLAWGLSGAFGPNASGPGTRTQVYATDVYLKYRPITQESALIIAITSEWFYRRREVPADVLSDLTGYSQLFVRFAPRWAAAARYEIGTPARGEDGRVAGDPLDPDWSAQRVREALSVSFSPSEYSRIRLQAEADLASWQDQPEYAAILAFEFSVGAHGAHVF